MNFVTPNEGQALPFGVRPSFGLLGLSSYRGIMKRD
jgi:hypothetical protein